MESKSYLKFLRLEDWSKPLQFTWEEHNVKNVEEKIATRFRIKRYTLKIAVLGFSFQNMQKGRSGMPYSVWCVPY